MALVWSALEITADPYVRIEARISPNTIRYVAIDGRRWEVTGSCDRRGNCLIGAVIEGERVRDHPHLDQIKAQHPNKFPGEYDTPVSPEFKNDTVVGGCCPLTVTEIAPEVPVV